MTGKDDLLRPTKADREKVKTMAALGIPHDIVARRFGFSEEELDGVFERELRTALPEMRAMGGANLFASAKAGNPSAVFFWLKTRAGWSETAHSEKHSSGEDAVKNIEKPGVRIFMPCNARGFCARTDLWIQHLEKMLKKTSSENSNR
jgi:hypothetical protein